MGPGDKGPVRRSQRCCRTSYNGTASHSKELPVPGRQWCPRCQRLGCSWGVSRELPGGLTPSPLENRRTPDVLAHSHHPGRVRLFSVVLLEWELLFWWLHTQFIYWVFSVFISGFLNISFLSEFAPANLTPPPLPQCTPTLAFLFYISPLIVPPLQLFVILLQYRL